jgi:general nucleoside transport system permease protein
MSVHAILQNAAPYILAAMGGLLTERAGVINIALEGLMLVGALAAVLIAHYTHVPMAGIAGAVVIGVAFVSLLAIFHLYLKADLILGGLALNLLAAGGTVYLLYAITGETGDSSSLRSYPLSEISIPVVRDIPVIDGLSGQSIIVYLALASLPAVAYFLYRTRLGTHIRAVGESEAAVLEAGLNGRAIKWKALALSGAFCALAGAQLSMDTTTTFVRDMTQGRGFIALGAIYLGAKHPVGTFVAALVFGVFDTLATTLQVDTTFSTDLVLMLPYVATLVALLIDGQRRRRTRNALAIGERPADVAESAGA